LGVVRGTVTVAVAVVILAVALAVIVVVRYGAVFNKSMINRRIVKYVVCRASSPFSPF
jgi:hypothetical protein